MLWREKEMLRILYQKQRQCTAGELSLLLNISSRTIKTDIKLINNTIKQYGCLIETKAGVGVWLSYDDGGKQYLKRILFEAESSNSVFAEMRKYRIADILLNTNDYISMECIAQKFYVTRGTITNDLNELADFFENYDIKLVRKVKFGVKLLGEEEKLRIAKVTVVQTIIENHDRLDEALIAPFFPGIELQSIQQILQTAEKKYGITLSDISFNALLINLANVIQRVRGGNKVQLAAQLVKYLKAERVWGISKYMVQKLEKAFDVQLDEQENGYLAIHLLTSKMQTEEVLVNSSANALNKFDERLYNVMMEALAEAGRVYSYDFANDNLLLSMLYLHLRPMLIRLEYNVFAQNPYLEALKTTYSYHFEIATFIANWLMKSYSFKIPESEIAYITMHVGASIERAKQRMQEEKIRIALVCTTGIGTSQFLKARFQTVFPNVTISKIVSMNKATKELVPGEVEFVVSTVPFSMDLMEVICVSPLLNDADIGHIRAKLNEKVVHPPENATYDTLASFIHDEITLLKCDCKTKDEALKILSSRMIQQQYVDEGFMDSVLDREKLASCSIGNLFAIPHAFEGHVKKQGIGVMTLKKAVPWGENKVRVILMLGIDIKAQEQFVRLFSDILEITKTPALVEKLLTLDKFGELEKTLLEEK